MRKIMITVVLGLILAALMLAVCLAGAGFAAPLKGRSFQTAAQQTVCPVLGGKINKDIYVDYKGQRVYFCCPGCVDRFNKEPDKYLNKLKG